MKTVLKLALLAGVATLFVACNTEDEPYKLRKKGNSSAKVYVVHPTLGDGPNFLVNYYDTQEALIANQPTESRVTGDSGFVIIDNLVPGDCFVESYVAGNPRLFDRDTIRLSEGAQLTVTLRLQPE
jgi:hypothetical protein